MKPAAGPAVKMGKKVRKGVAGFEFWRVYEVGCFDNWLAEIEAGERGAIYVYDHIYSARTAVAATDNETLSYKLSEADSSVLEIEVLVPEEGDGKRTRAQMDLEAILDQGLINEQSIGGFYRDWEWDIDSPVPLQRVKDAVIEETSIVPRGSMSEDAVLRWKT